MRSLCPQSPDGKRIALSSESGQVFIFDLESGSLTTTYTSHAMAVRSLAWSYDGQVSPIRFFGSMSIQLRCLAVTSHSVGRQAPRLARRPFDSFRKTRLWCSRDAHRPLILGPECGYLSRRPSRRLWVCTLHPVTMTSLTCPYSSADKSIKVWDLAARASVSTTQESGEVWGVAWRPKPAPTGSAGAFVSGGQDGLVRWWRSAGSGV